MCLGRQKIQSGWVVFCRVPSVTDRCDCTKAEFLYPAVLLGIRNETCMWKTSMISLCIHIEALWSGWTGAFSGICLNTAWIQSYLSIAPLFKSSKWRRIIIMPWALVQWLLLFILIHTLSVVLPEPKHLALLCLWFAAPCLAYHSSESYHLVCSLFCFFLLESLCGFLGLAHLFSFFIVLVEP